MFIKVVPTVKIVTSTETNGRLVEAEQYSEFVQQSVAVLLAAQREMEVEASRLLDTQLAMCFNEIQVETTALGPIALSVLNV